VAPNYDIFLSYSHHDVSIAMELRAALATAGFSCFMAEKDVSVSDKWERQVRAALQSSGQVLVLVTPRSCHSNWLLLESGASWILQKKLIPLLMFVTADDLPEPLREYQARIIETKAGVQLLVDELEHQRPRGAHRGQNARPDVFSLQDLLAELEVFLGRITQERWIPDLIVGSGRGGVIVGAIIATNLGHKPLKMVDCQFRWAGSRRITTLDASSLLSDDISNKKVLVVESTRQAGETYKLIAEALAKHSPAEVRSFATIWRTGSPSKPDYYAFSLETIPKEPWGIGFLYSRHDHYM
jgi:hypothetical protein